MLPIAVEPLMLNQTLMYIEGMEVAILENRRFHLQLLKVYLSHFNLLTAFLPVKNTRINKVLKELLISKISKVFVFNSFFF